ncbi:MAG: MinD/ParA family protein, partial [Cyanobacteria bacterium P01_A01_bin.135]
RLVRELNLDYLLIDTHPGLSKETFLSMAISNLSLLILRPDNQDFQGTAVTVNVAKQLRVRKMLLLLNKVLSRTNVESLKDQVEKIYGVPVAGAFPLSEDIAQLGSRGIFCLKFPQHPFSQEVNRVARQILS